MSTKPRRAYRPRHSVKKPRRTGWTAKRAPYRTYSHAPWDWGDVLRYLDVGLRARPPTTISAVAAQYHINRSVLSRHYKLWLAGDAVNDGTIDRRGGHNRAFDPIVEEAMAAHIRSKYIVRGVPFIDADLVRIALAGRYPFMATRSQNNFRASHRYVTRFKRQWGFSSRRPKVNKRAVRVVTAEEDKAYVDECSLWLERVGSDMFMNMDETAWRLVNKSLLIWNDIGAPFGRHVFLCNCQRLLLGLAAVVFVVAMCFLVPFTFIWHCVHR